VSQACGSGSAVGGLAVGENFQDGHLFWGLSADIHFATERKAIRSWCLPAPIRPRAGTWTRKE
jgi:hypothetical protein